MRMKLCLFYKALPETSGSKDLFILFPDSSASSYAVRSVYVMVLHRRPIQALRFRPMFSILRFILIVGAIFYYSPVRQQGDGAAAIEAFFLPKKSEQASSRPAPATGEPGHLETVWKALPDSAKQAVVDKILTSSGLPVANAAKPSDTLRPEDRDPAAPKPRT
jgi:hypothetical protein